MYLQVDMGAVRHVCAVATQGLNSNKFDEWTTSYKLRLSSDGIIWNTYKENNAEKVTNNSPFIDSHKKDIISNTMRT